jgi:hypothetical protein
MRYIPMMHACEVHAREVHTHEMHACEMHVYEVHTHEMHAHEMHACEVYAREMHAREVSPPGVSRSNKMFQSDSLLFPNIFDVHANSKSKLPIAVIIAAAKLAHILMVGIYEISLTRVGPGASYGVRRPIGTFSFLAQKLVFCNSDLDKSTIHERTLMIYLFLTGVHPTSVHLIGGCLMGVYLTGVYLLGVYLTGVHLTCVHLTGVHLMEIHFKSRHVSQVHLMAMCLMGVHLTGMCLMGVYLIPSPVTLSILGAWRK